MSSRKWMFGIPCPSRLGPRHCGHEFNSAKRDVQRSKEKNTSNDCILFFDNMIDLIASSTNQKL
tara:strand:+ start:147 stop:338 length:192 start_codon:yes stop_codon:yes gene_type:complete